MRIANRIMQVLMLAAGFCFWTAVSLPKLHSQSIDQDSIVFINNSGENALVKVVGPSRSTVLVPNGQSRTVVATPGNYHILVRYGEPGRYRFSRGDNFEFEARPGYYSTVSITLHKVINGNYGSRQATQNEFESSN